MVSTTEQFQRHFFFKMRDSAADRSSAALKALSEDEIDAVARGLSLLNHALAAQED